MSVVGKTVRIRITCVDPAEREVDVFETEGTIEIENGDWIGVRRNNFPELFGLPPGADRLEQGDDVDFTADMTVRVLDPEELLVIRGLGYRPTGHGDRR
ncbi:MAG: hypothetical protein JO017_09595 [Actinobacteria bacterium]|nr:hypothetical protein [Actinomycetota bacterium]